MIGVGSALISLFLVLVCYSLTLTAKRADENLLMICEQNQKIEEEKGKQEMESKRDILRVIEKEIKKGSTVTVMATPLHLSLLNSETMAILHLCSLKSMHYM